MSLFPGDEAIVRALIKYRYLTTALLAKLTGRSEQVIRRAMRTRLVPQGLVVRMARNMTEENSYGLGSVGMEFAAHEGGRSVAELPFPRNMKFERGMHFRHTLATVELRVSLDVAASEDACPVSIVRTIPEYETLPSAKAGGARRFLLSERFFSGSNRQVAPHHGPDCCFLMCPKVDREKVIAALLEMDRGTEAVASRIRAKYERLFAFYSRRGFSDFDAIAMRVLFVVDEPTCRRIGSMQQELSEFAKAKGAMGTAFRRCFRFARRRDLTSSTILTRPVWVCAENQPRIFYTPVQPPPPGASGEVAA